MSKMIEMPDPLYRELAEAAEADGTTPLGWIAARLRLLRSSTRGRDTSNDPTRADRLAGIVGVVASGGEERLSERHSEVFSEILEEKRRTGTL